MLLNLFNEMRAAKVPVSVRELLTATSGDRGTVTMWSWRRNPLLPERRRAANFVYRRRAPVGACLARLT